MSTTPCAAQIARARSRSATFPRMCESTQNRAPDAAALRARSSRHIVYSGVHSTYTGSQPACTTAEGTAAKVKTLLSTRSPGRL